MSDQTTARQDALIVRALTARCERLETELAAERFERRKLRREMDAWLIRDLCDEESR